jgi:rare lipoprotein A (peptidoglycan hydrolase)
MAKSWSQTLLLASLAGALAGCGTIPDRPVSIRPAGTDLKAASSEDEPIPRVEPPSRSGNADTYVVFGRRYRVRETSEGYREQGTASWYGADFHGRKTSSGPLYDMYELTAAHKSLPLPAYVRVTNLENGRSTVVKVTDRGPFVSGRIIDLSYAAALRLDMLERGTALVEVAALEPYQYLPELVARRAAERERLAAVADRKAQRLVSVVPVQDKPDATERLASAAPVARTELRGKPDATERLASAAPVARAELRGKPDATERLASAAPVAKGKNKPVERRAAPAGRMVPCIWWARSAASVAILPGSCKTDWPASCNVMCGWNPPPVATTRCGYHCVIRARPGRWRFAWPVWASAIRASSSIERRRADVGAVLRGHPMGVAVCFVTVSG